MQYTVDELKNILELHRKYLYNEEGGICADLSGANLIGANLIGANLSRANLSRAYLSGAYLSDADLSCADLSRANLSCADLSCADLIGANLIGANLSNANLSCADLSDLQKSRLSIVPETGSFEGWKQCRDGVLVHLLIPTDAKRSNATGRKCRASHVRVLEVIGAEVGYSKNPSGGSKTEYRSGELIYSKNEDGEIYFEEDRFRECAEGIHFYLTRIEAEND